MRAALAALFAAAATATDPSVGASTRVTSHATHSAIDRSEIDYSTEAEIKEFHFHTYFHLFQTAQDCPQCNASYIAAERLRSQLIAAVAAREFVAVCAGITDRELPGLNVSSTYPVNLHPQGPHPAGSFETWVPREYLSQVMSYFLVHRQELTIFFHPLSAHAVEDHAGRSAFFGPPMRLNLNALDDAGDPLQYPELGLGYSRRAVSAADVESAQWWRAAL
jgi:DOPA 4,5-dioxygenase